MKPLTYRYQTSDGAFLFTDDSQNHYVGHAKFSDGVVPMKNGGLGVSVWCRRMSDEDESRLEALYDSYLEDAIDTHAFHARLETIIRAFVQREQP